VLTALSVQDLVKWSMPKGKKLDNVPIDPSENEVLTMTGWVRLVKISPDDCDIHIQLGGFASQHVPQIIAEIPPSDHAAAKAGQVTLTGWAFDDSSHWAMAHPKTGNQHGSGVGTLWEIHPVWDVR
jgi:hypothetical protein